MVHIETAYPRTIRIVQAVLNRQHREMSEARKSNEKLYAQFVVPVISIVVMLCGALAATRHQQDRLRKN